MKKINFITLISFLIVSFVAFGSHSLSQAQQTARKFEQQAPGKVPVYKIKAAEIYNFGLRTDAKGAWYWEVWVKNIGGVEYPKNSLKVQGFQILQNNRTVPASGLLVPKDLAPGEMVMVKSYWTRCCQADNLEIRFELWDVSASPHKKLWDKQVFIAGLNVKVNDISWDVQKKEWTATIKNLRGNALKITIQAFATHSIPLHWVGAGGFSKLIPPDGILTQKGYYPDYHLGAGDRLKIEIRYFDNASYCGGSGYCVIDSKEIVLP